jgi:hypothetical protein
MLSCARATRGLRKDGMGSLVVLLLAERARSEGARSTRALEDQPGYPIKRKTSDLGRIIWMDVGRSMREVETTPAASLNTGAGEELSSGLVWPASLVPHVSRQRTYACSEGRAGRSHRSVKCKVKQCPQCVHPFRGGQGARGTGREERDSGLVCLGYLVYLVCFVCFVDRTTSTRETR